MEEHLEPFVEIIIKENPSSLYRGKGYTVKGADYDGYVVCHKTHPFFYRRCGDFPEIKAPINFIRRCGDIDWDEVKPEWRSNNYKLFGFSTFFKSFDASWTKERVEKEIREIYGVFYMEEVKRVRMLKKGG